jgi:Protein of unknown function (DUF4019)/Protein of unknown function (DUF3887)
MKAFSRGGATAQRKTKAFHCAVAPLRERAFSEKRYLSIFLILLSSLTVAACRQEVDRPRVPSEVNEVVTNVGENIAQERYEQIYNESSDLWKKDVSLEQSNEVFKTLRTKLGKPESRTLHSATEQQNSGGVLKGHIYILTYQTRFERGDGMETFTLIEDNGRWLLARYFVNSTALK